MVPVITLPLLPLSKSASTDSCNILFSFLIMISGALNSINRDNRLFLFITLLYRSLRSEDANLPPSSGTSGLNSGGITGMLVSIIHSGLFPEEINASNIFIRFTSFSESATALVSSNFFLRASSSSTSTILSNTFLTDSAPIPAENPSSPYSSFAASNSSSSSN